MTPSPSPFVTDPATLFARRVASDANTVSNRTRRLADTLAELDMPAMAVRLMAYIGTDQQDSTLLVIRATLRRSLTAANATGSNQAVAAYRTALDEVGALWAVL